MKRPRITLGTRIAATVAAAVLGSTVIVTFTAYELERSGTESRFVAAAHAGATADVQQAAAAVKRQPDLAPLRAIGAFVSQRGGMQWMAVDMSDREGVSSGLPTGSIPASLWERLGPGDVVTEWTHIGRTPMLAIGATVAADVEPSLTTPSPSPAPPQAVRVTPTTTHQIALVEFYNFGPVEQQLGRLRSDLIRLDVVSIVVASILGIAVATGISRPVRRAAAAAQRLGRGALDTRVAVHGNNELADLAVSFNDMARRLSDAMHALQSAQAQQRSFVADVSHELRTPLAAMIAAADGLSDPDDDARRRSGELVEQQTRRMHALVENLLEISRFDAGQARLELETIDLGALVDDVIRTVAPEQDVQTRTLGDPVVTGDARRLHTILRNLVGNAIQHGAPPVRVLVDGRTDLVHVSVSDAGPGVDPRIAPTLFDRFVRADTSRSTGSGSTGLGLAIAMENAHLHGATLSVIPGPHASFVLALQRVRGS